MASSNPSLADALIEVSQAISSGTNLISILAKAKDVAVRLIGAERASIFLLDKSGQEIWTLLADETQMIRMPAGKGIVGEVIKNQLVLNIADASSDDRFYADIDRRTGYVTRNILCAPVRNRHGTAFGALELLNKKNGEFTKDDEQLLAVFSAQAGLAIEHVEMYEDLQQNLAQIQLLCRIQENFNALMGFHQIFEGILSQLLALVGGLKGAVYIVMAGKQTYFGYQPGIGLVSWEADEARQCPEFLKEIISAVDKVQQQLQQQHFISLPDLVCAELLKGDTSVGYLAVELENDESRLFNARPADYLKVIAAQTVSFLEKKEVLEEKKRSEKQALLGSMLSMIVHDMKNPLCGASGFAQLINQRSSDTNIQSYSRKILDVLERLEKMNNELLMFVRGDSIQLEKSVIGLKSYIERLIASFSESFSHAHIAVSVHAEGDQEIEIEADSDRLLRVLTNILVNAREAIDSAGAINIWLSKKGSMAEIRISDTGKGMPAYIQQSVFEPFVTHGKKNGTGLGMAIARNIIEKHGGSIGVESMLGKGTTFIINLPIL